MVRLYKQHARQLLLMLKALKKAKPEMSLDDFEEKTQEAPVVGGDDSISISSQARRFFDSVKHGGKATKTTFDELVENIEAQVNAPKGFEKDLIDTVVSILGLPLVHAGNIQHGTIEALKKAVMRPDELLNLKNALGTFLYKCPSCERSMGNGEPVLISSKNGVVQLQCMACRFPPKLACQKCHNQFSAGTTQMHRLVNALTCGNCKAGKSPQPPQTAGSALDDSMLEAVRRAGLGTNV